MRVISTKITNNPSIVKLELDEFIVRTENFEFIGELALDGQLRPISGTLSIAIACQQAGH